MMKRIIQILIVGFATCFLMSFLIPRPKLAMENEGTVADWLPVDTSPVASGFEVEHVRDEIKAEVVKHSAKQGGGTVASFEPKSIYGQKVQKSFAAKIIRIVDGDTVELLLEDKTHPNFRLASIDAPERGQAFGAKATEVVKPFVGQVATVHQTDVDRWQRPIAFIVLEDGTNVNAAMIDAGLAWHYTEYSNSVELQQLESAARAAQRGLWVDPDAMAPWTWTWRKVQRERAE